MSKRFLAIVIDADNYSCGDCWYGEYASNGCYLWHDKKREEGMRGHMRVAECLAAEQLDRKMSR